MARRDKLFSRGDEKEFKRQYVIQFLASYDAVQFRTNNTLGWHNHRPAVEDAQYLADKAWMAWQDTIGLER